MDCTMYSCQVTTTGTRPAEPGSDKPRLSKPTVTEGALLPADERAEWQRRNQVELSMLPAARYPRLVECALPMSACDDPDFHYRFGIELFIDGVRAAAARLEAQGSSGSPAR